jgi:hypothetical protein
MSNLTAWVAAAKHAVIDFNDDEYVIKREPAFYEFEDDILAYVIAWSKMGIATFECHELIQRSPERENDPAYNITLTDDDREEAAVIRRFFQNKIMFRALNDEHVSKWMSSVTELLASPKKILHDHIKIIVTLPRFYKESKDTEALFKQCVSLDPNNLWVGEFDEVYEHIGTVHRDSKHENEYRYYFKNSKNQVLAMFLPSNSPALPLWKYMLAKNNRVKIKAHLGIGRQPGHDFYYYKLGNFYEISDADS